MIAINVDADREAAVGIDLEFDRGLSAQATPTPCLQDQALVKQPIDDARDSRLRQARLTREVSARDRSVAMNLAQNERAIVLTRLFRVRTGQVDHGPRRRRNALHQPFTAPAVIALRINRWRSRKTTIAGRTEMRQAAASSCVEVELSRPWNVKIPTAIGIRSVRVNRRKGTRNCDQPAITEIMKTEAIPGTASGTMIRPNS